MNRIIEKLNQKKLPYCHISPEHNDLTLDTRVKQANRIYEADRNAGVLSIQVNPEAVTGIEGYTTKRITLSDRNGYIILKNLETDMPDVRMRFDWSDGERDKVKDFIILKKPKAPACLIECWFMDNQNDYTLLWNYQYLGTITYSVVNSLEKIYKM